MSKPDFMQMPSDDILKLMGTPQYQTLLQTLASRDPTFARTLHNTVRCTLTAHWLCDLDQCIYTGQVLRDTGR